ncbi:MAG: cobalamin-dependent protein [Alphaproteobacteria bacterium]|nr:cobalamin-dependent protein [Alphaproteobacteria bacterium]
MRIRLAYVGSSISSFGVRLLGALLLRDDEDVHLHFILAENFRKLSSILFSDASSRLSSTDIERIGAELACADLVGLSCFSEYAGLTKDIIAAIRRHNPKAFIVWGGVHPTADPEDCIAHADAVGIGEAEISLPALVQRIKRNEPFLDVPGFWFRQDDAAGPATIRNAPPPLLTSEQLDLLPHPLFGEREYIFSPGDQGFRPLGAADYVQLDALSYNTMWSRGCPFKCSYCGNTRLIEIDADYARIRHSSPEHIIAEVESILTRFAHIKFVVFHDDCLISLPEAVLKEFSERWRARIGLPFAVTGLTPVHIRDDKVKALLAGGLNRVRMGIQSGSDAILKFYGRPNRPGLIRQATDILGQYAKLMMPPHYDMIFDNPIETKEDIAASLRLLNDMPRPYMINVFSLRYIPNTQLGRQLAEVSVDIEKIERDYTSVMSTFANALMYLVALVRLPAPLFDYLLRFARPYPESVHPAWQPVILLLRAALMAKRAYFHIRWGDYSIVFGKLGLLLQRLGLQSDVRSAPNRYSGLLPRRSEP